MLNKLPQDVIAHKISPYLEMQDLSALRLTSKTALGLFKPHYLQKLANKLLLEVMRGDKEKARGILRIYPELLEMTATATDYSNRTFTTTAFRYALWALDTRYMCNMMVDCLPNSPQGERIKQQLLTQYEEQTQNGLDYKLNGVTIHETHYDFTPLINALQEYVNNYDNWYAHKNFNRLSRQWTQEVGGAQRNVPVHVAQHYCDPYHKKTFVRSLEFDHYEASNIYGHVTLTPKLWFDGVSPNSGLGVKFGVASNVMSGAGLNCVTSWIGYARAGAESWAGWSADYTRILHGPYPGRVSQDLAVVIALRQKRTEDLAPLKQRLKNPNHAPYVEPETAWWSW